MDPNIDPQMTQNDDRNKDAIPELKHLSKQQNINTSNHQYTQIDNVSKLKKMRAPPLYPMKFVHPIGRTLEHHRKSANTN